MLLYRLPSEHRDGGRVDLKRTTVISKAKTGTLSNVGYKFHGRGNKSHEYRHGETAKNLYFLGKQRQLQFTKYTRLWEKP